MAAMEGTAVMTERMAAFAHSFLHLAEWVRGFAWSGFDVDWAMGWLNRHWYLCVFIVVAYLLTIFSLRRFMAKRPGLELRWCLVAWNSVLALYSVLGLLVALPDFFPALRANGFRASYCRNQGYYQGPAGFWSFLFLISKVVELGDTVFIILRKRPLIFLQWYHHTTVLLFTWFSYAAEASVMRWGVTTNIGVHALMYAYFAARAARIPLPSWSGMVVTTTQMAQFVLGIGVCIDTALTVFAGQYCELSLFICIAQLGMYLSYFLLFAHFFYKNYIAKPRPKTA